jgi:uncharacterized membrane protein
MKRIESMAKSDEQIQRESTKKIESAARKALPAFTGRSGGVADWSNAEPNLIHELVCTVGVENGAVRFGYTRDGGAYSIGLYLGTNSKTYYCNEAEGINEQLKELIQYFKD